MAWTQTRRSLNGMKILLLVRANAGREMCFGKLHFRHGRPSSSTFQLSLVASKPSHWCLIRKSIQSFLAHFWYFTVIRDLMRESYITERETALWNWKYLCWIVSGMVSFLWKPWLSIVCYNWDVSEDWCISFSGSPVMPETTVPVTVPGTSLKECFRACLNWRPSTC